MQGVTPIRSVEPRGSQRAIGAALLVAAACCVGATAAALWNSDRPSANSAKLAHEAIAHSVNAKEREQAVTRVANEAIDAIESLQMAAKGTDRAGQHAKEYLRQLSRFAGEEAK